MTRPTNITNQVRQHRLAKDLTQEQLASQLGVSRQTLIAIENGKYSPSLEFAFALARALDVEIGQLFSYPE
ncbi:MAG: helix-turn-helix transcriptional regulator [Micrococcales bacterium]|nr:helix-turn-helix transcriptional regulator [Micrococcales bacterium]MBT5398096.1 helix-turn-helix transcriptional regulator [Micrococcales bacterium]MBT5431035.1 helix-turn-helix transcriptional regulator [Micrococcales bacterium]MBT7926523.1 helix-turn-helix transcriptional regulator [Micrococcales bacterium]MDG1817420.1 helix-turn-helix transcriptional regulator [Aquiluna sp.]